MKSIEKKANKLTQLLRQGKLSPTSVSRVSGHYRVPLPEVGNNFSFSPDDLQGLRRATSDSSVYSRLFDTYGDFPTAGEAYNPGWMSGIAANIRAAHQGVNLPALWYSPSTYPPVRPTRVDPPHKTTQTDPAVLLRRWSGFENEGVSPNYRADSNQLAVSSLGTATSRHELGHAARRLTPKMQQGPEMGKLRKSLTTLRRVSPALHHQVTSDLELFDEFFDHTRAARGTGAGARRLRAATNMRTLPDILQPYRRTIDRLGELFGHEPNPTPKQVSVKALLQDEVLGQPVLSGMDEWADTSIPKHRLEMALLARAMQRAQRLRVDPETGFYSAVEHLVRNYDASVGL